MKQRVFIYKSFERFWHWTQAALIIILAITGFEIHGSLRLVGFERAFNIHNGAAWGLIGLTIFAIFWHITTGEWRQYIPTSKKLRAILHYYTLGIFKNEPHPFKKSEVSKLNPLQRLTYLAFKVLIIPVQVTTGLLYFYYSRWPEWGLAGRIDTVAFIHTAAAFAMVVFFILHVYMTTTGHTVTSHIRAMITGWEEIEVEPADQPGAAPAR